MPDQLFEPEPVEDPKQQSYTVRLTIRRRDLLARGVHPATGARLLDTGQTCADCAHSFAVRPHRARYWKCDRVQVTRGPGTDIRVGWPACSMFELRDDHDA